MEPSQCGADRLDIALRERFTIRMLAQPTQPEMLWRAAVVRGVGPDDAVAQRDGPGRLVDAAPVTGAVAGDGAPLRVVAPTAWKMPPPWAVPPGALAALLLMVDCLVVTVPPSRLAIPPPLTVPAEALPLLPRTALLFTVNAEGADADASALDGAALGGGGVVADDAARHGQRRSGRDPPPVTKPPGALARLLRIAVPVMAIEPPLTIPAARRRPPGVLAVLPLTMLFRKVAEPKLLIPAPKPQEVTQLVVLRVLSATRLLMIVNEPLLPMPPPLALPVPVLPTVLPLT